MREIYEELNQVHGVDPFVQMLAIARFGYFRLHGHDEYSYFFSLLRLQPESIARHRAPVSFVLCPVQRHFHVWEFPALRATDSATSLRGVDGQQRRLPTGMRV